MSEFIKRMRSLDGDLRYLWIAVFCLMVGFGIYSATFYNFATEILHIKPIQLGYVEAVREAPGLLCVLFAAITMSIAEPVVASVSLSLMAVGMCAYAAITGIHSLLLWSFVWSIGFHVWMPVQSSLVLNLSKEGNKGKKLGQIAGVGSVGQVVGMLLVMAINYRLSYQVWFLAGGCSIALAAIVMLRVRRNIGHSNKPRFVLKKKYSVYYALTFLEGCRKQVFMTFAVYALTRVYGTPLQTVAVLMVINGIVNIIEYPIVGRLIDRIGERKILAVSYGALIFVFLGYAIIHKANILYVLYCLDNLFFVSSTCLTTYMQKIAEPEDLMPTLSMGVTFNHLAAVLVPLIGGFLWARFAYPATFFGGAFVVAISLLFVAKVPRKVVKKHS